MHKKIVAQFEYDGLGFPVLLLNFPVIEVRGVTVPDTNYNELQKNVLLALSRKAVPFTGNEVRFIRQYLQMNYTEFAKQFGVTHASVLHWEGAKNEFAKITPSTELCIRLSILDILKAKDKLFRETFRNFNHQMFRTQRRTLKDKHIALDSRTMWK